MEKTKQLVNLVSEEVDAMLRLSIQLTNDHQEMIMFFKSKKEIVAKHLQMLCQIIEKNVQFSSLSISAQMTAEGIMSLKKKIVQQENEIKELKDKIGSSDERYLRHEVTRLEARVKQLVALPAYGDYEENKSLREKFEEKKLEFDILRKTKDDEKSNIARLRRTISSLEKEREERKEADQKMIEVLNLTNLQKVTEEKLDAEVKELKENIKKKDDGLIKAENTIDDLIKKNTQLEQDYNIMEAQLKVSQEKMVMLVNESQVTLEAEQKNNGFHIHK